MCTAKSRQFFFDKEPCAKAAVLPAFSTRKINSSRVWRTRKTRKIDTFFSMILVSIFCAYKNIQNLQTSQGYIFHILQHFTTKLCNFTNFNMLFNTVVLNFTISKIFKSLSIMQSVHCTHERHCALIFKRRLPLILLILKFASEV